MRLIQNSYERHRLFIAIKTHSHLRLSKLFTMHYSITLCGLLYVAKTTGMPNKNGVQSSTFNSAKTINTLDGMIHFLYTGKH